MCVGPPGWRPARPASGPGRGGGRLVVAGSVVGQWGPSPARSRGSRAGRKTKEKKDKVSQEKPDVKTISVKQVLVKKEPVLPED